MPTIQNPNFQSDNSSFKNDVEQILRQYSAYYILNESPIQAPSAGYKAYDKKIAFAQKAQSNPELYTDVAADLISALDSTMVSQTFSGSGVQDFFRFLYSDNPTGRNILEAQVGVASGYNHVGTQSSKSIFEALAKVTQLDYI